jgi:hypothetical protein
MARSDSVFPLPDAERPSCAIYTRRSRVDVCHTRRIKRQVRISNDDDPPRSLRDSLGSSHLNMQTWSSAAAGSGAAPSQGDSLVDSRPTLCRREGSPSQTAWAVSAAGEDSDIEITGCRFFPLHQGVPETGRPIGDRVGVMHSSLSVAMGGQLAVSPFLAFQSKIQSLRRSTSPSSPACF